MSKQAIYLEEAKRLYVNEGFSLDAIVGMLGNKVSRKTLYNWKVQGDWDTKRRNYLKETKDIHDELIEIARLTIKRAKADPTPKNLLSMFRSISTLKNFAGVGLIDEETTPDERKGLTEDTIRQIEKEVLGLE